MLDLSIPLVCLALNVYHESRAEPLAGQLAVALTTLNRAKHRKDKICDVVFKKYQFSWTQLPEWAPKDKRAWERSIKVAQQAWKIEDFTNGATHFHATYVYPRWAPNLQYLGKWGNHLFYKKGKK